MGKDFKWIYETIDFEHRDARPDIKGRYVPVLKFGGTKKYIERNDKNDNDCRNNISYVIDGWECSDRKAQLDGVHGINRVRFSPGGRFIAGCSTNGIIYLYDLYENKLLSKIITKIDNISDISISDDERYIYACGNNSLIELFDTREKRIIYNDNISKYVDASIYSLLKSREHMNTSSASAALNTVEEADKNLYQCNNDQNLLDNIIFPYKTIYSNPSTRKMVYVPIFNYSDMLKNKIDIIDVSNVYINPVNEYISKSVYSIPNSHFISTTCIAIPQRKNYLIYSGGADGLMKVWDTRSNVFMQEDHDVRNLTNGLITRGEKNPFVSFCCHEGVITSLCFNHTLDYEKEAYLKREEIRMMEKKNKKAKKIQNFAKGRSSEGKLSQMENFPADVEKKSETDEKEKEEYEEEWGMYSCDDSDMSSKFSYSSLEFDLTKKKHNSFYMTSSYDGYVRVYDMDNNVLKTYRHENKNVTHAMFSYNNKFIISTTKSKYAQVVDFLYMNNKSAVRDIQQYLKTYEKYYLNCVEDTKERESLLEEEKKENENSIIRMLDVFKIKEDAKRHFTPFSVKNIMQDKEMRDEIQLVNDFNAIRNKKYKRRARRAGLHDVLSDNPIVRLDRKNFFQSMEINSDSSAYDEVSRKKKHYFDRINKHFSPLWLYFVDDHHHMNLIPYKKLAHSLKENHEYVETYYANFQNRSSVSANQKPNFMNDAMKKKKECLYNKMSKAIRSGISIPKFYSCVAGDKCIIPSIDTCAHVYDIITGLHINTLHNLYAPNYHINYFSSSNEKYKDIIQKKLSFITSVDSYPRNQSIIATSNGNPDGSIVMWVYTPF